MGTGNDKNSKDFIFDIDDTIDNLFQPTRKIEIDPLTQEIINLDEGASASAETSPSSEIPASVSSEIKMEDTSQKEEKFTASSNVPIHEHIDLIHQQLLTIEWDANDRELQVASRLVAELADYSEVKASVSVTEMVDMMGQLMELMSESPETVSTKAPFIMTEGVKALSILFNPDSPGSQAEFDTKFKELSKEFLDITDESMKAATAMTESEEVLELELEPEPAESSETDDAAEEEQGSSEERDAEEMTLELEPLEVASASAETGGEDKAESAGESVKEHYSEQAGEEPGGGGDLLDDLLDEQHLDLPDQKKVREAPLKENVESSSSEEAVLPLTAASTAKRETVDDAVEAVVQSPEIDNERLLSAVSKHIDELDRCLNKIRPVEALLAKTSGMEKLCKFQSGIRAVLERERARLADVAGVDIAASRDTSAIHEKVAEKRGTSALPWQRLAMVEWCGKALYLPSDEIACVRKLSIFKRGKLAGASEFNLAMYKSMPWSKIGACMKGALKEKNENELAVMNVPLIRLGDVPVKSDSPILLLHNGSDGVAMPISGEPKYLNTDNLTMSGETDEPWQSGYVEDEKGHRLPVATIASLKEGFKR